MLESWATLEKVPGKVRDEPLEAETGGEVR